MAELLLIVSENPMTIRWVVAGILIAGSICLYVRNLRRRLREGR